MLRRNEGRADAVPGPAIYSMLEKLVMPNVSEAQEAEWVLA